MYGPGVWQGVVCAGYDGALTWELPLLSEHGRRLVVLWSTEAEFMREKSLEKSRSAP